jgi:hypothetical protein
MTIDCHSCGCGQAQVGGQRGQRGPRENAVEHRVEVVQRVADLVDRQRLGLAQPPSGVEGLFLEEAVHGRRWR